MVKVRVTVLFHTTLPKSVLSVTLGVISPLEIVTPFPFKFISGEGAIVEIDLGLSVAVFTLYLEAVPVQFCS